MSLTKKKTVKNTNISDVDEDAGVQCPEFDTGEQDLAKINQKKEA